MNIERKELEELLMPVLEKLSVDSRKVNKIKKELEKYDILEGKTAQLFNQPELIRTEDLRLVCLLTESVYKATKNSDLTPSAIFTVNEMKEAKLYSGQLEFFQEDPLFPFTLDNAMLIDNSVYMAMMSIQDINKLLVNGGLNYNFDIQREAKVERKGDTIITSATLYKKSVEEIAQHLIEGTLVPTVLVFNAAVRSSDEGDELVYEAKKNLLTVTAGTRLDILDGYHRCKGSQLALSINPDLEFNFPVMFTNYSTPKAQRYLGQIAKANPIDKARAEELAKTNHASTVIQQLREESILRGKISAASRIRRINNEIVSVGTLMTAIDEEFKMKNKRDAMDVADYLVEFFDQLIGYYSDEFIDKYDEVNKVSFINSNQMFNGYIVLARRMFELGMKPKEVRNIISKIDFSKNNKLWTKIGLVKKGSVDHNNAKKIIKKFFNELELGEQSNKISG